MLQPFWLDFYTFCRKTLLLILFCLYSVALVSQDLPFLPDTKDVVTCFPDTTGYRRITVGPVDRDYSDLQQAINAAPLGSVLILDAGIPFYGGFTLPDKGAGEDWIIMMSSRMDLIPEEGTRIRPMMLTGDAEFPTQESAMPKFITTNLSGIPAIKTQSFSHHYRLVGIEISVDQSVINSYGLINLGDASASQNSLLQVPHHFVIDRCYIHGHDESEIMKYGIRMDCFNAAIIDCHISQFHSVGFDAQAISGINGPGKFKIINNYLEGSGENILFGGGAPAIPGLVPSDIEIRQNHFYKPWSWRVGHPEYSGKHWTIKNLFELKTGTRVWLDGNVLENCWADLPVGQSGYAILLTVRTEGGASPQADVSDIMISNNIIRHVGAGISISGTDGVASNRSSRIMVYNNLFVDISGPAYGDLNTAGPNDGTLLKIGEPQDVIIDHNSIFQTGPVTWAYQVTDGFVFTNNLTNSYISKGGYQGIYGPGQSQGNNTIANYFPDITDANMHFHKNVLIGGNASRYTNYNNLSQNYFPATPDEIGFVDYINADLDYHGYALTSSSPFYQAGSDGKDIGVNFSVLDSALVFKSPCDSLNTSTRVLPARDFEVKVFPNPANEIVFVSMYGEGRVSYKIHDLTGRLIISGEGDKSGIKIVTEHFPPGVFIISLYSPDARSGHLFTVR